WSEQQKIMASDGTPNNGFGGSVSLFGDTAVIGAYNGNRASGFYAGSAYVFARTGSTWGEQQKLLAPDAAMGDFFGGDVSIFGPTAVAGAGGHDTAGLDGAGAAYVYQALSSTDASVTKNDGQSNAVPGTPVTYTITVGDTGPDPGVGIRVVDTPPAELTDVSWACAATPGSSCPASGSGSIDHTVNVDVGGTLTYTVTGTISPSATGT